MQADDMARCAAASCLPEGAHMASRCFLPCQSQQYASSCCNGCHHGSLAGCYPPAPGLEICPAIED